MNFLIISPSGDEGQRRDGHAKRQETANGGSSLHGDDGTDLYRLTFERSRRAIRSLALDSPEDYVRSSKRKKLRKEEHMVEKIEDLPDGVLGFSARGSVTRSDYERVIIPAVKKAFTEHPEVRFLYSLGADFSGFEAVALWEDAKIGLAHLGSWGRVAVVTDVEWIRRAVKAFGFLVHGHVRIFPNDELARARTWISEEL